MAHVTPIVSDAQVEYRLSEAHGCGSHHDTSLEYRVQGMGGRQLWLGQGLAEVGLVHGGEFTEASMPAARALMAGTDPRSGEQLVAPVLRLPEEAKLPATALIDAVVSAGREERVTLVSAKGAAEWARLLEGARRLGDGYTVDVRLLDRVAGRAGLNLDAVYEPARVTGAREVAAGERLDVRVRGYDLTLTLPKSFSVAWALAADSERQAITDAYTQAAVETVATAEEWHARAVRGHHGGGQSAEVVATSGLLGWLSVDPVNRNGDAHWHAHVTLASLGKGADGQWSALSSAGQDSLFSSVHALGALMEVRARALCAERFGWTFRESEVTNRLEVSHVPDAAIRATSTRRADVVQALLDAGVDPETASREEDDTAARAARAAKLEGATAMPTIVDRTRGQLEAEGVDPLLPRRTDHTDAVTLRPVEAGRRSADGLVMGSWDAAVTDARARLLDPDLGPTAHAQSFTHRQALAVIATGVHGGVDRADYELLLAAALDTPGLVRLPERAGHQLSYTTAAILDAEKTVLAAAVASTQHTRMPVVTEAQLRAALGRFERRNGYAASVEQVAAVRRIVFGGAGFDVVTGLPGTGKTTVMRIVGEAYREAGYGVGGLAVAAIAAEGLASEAGFPAGTVAAFALTGAPINVDVLVVDEAGMVDTRDMARILQRAEAEGVKVIAIGDDRQLPAVGIGGWFAPARELTEGPELVDVRRQRHEHELAALRAYRAGDEQEALGTYARAGQVVVMGTRAEAVAAAARLWGERTASIGDPLQRIEDVALMAGRREDTQILNALARAHARDAGQLAESDTTYRLMGGGELHLAVGDLVVLRRNQVPDGQDPGLRNGRRAVVEDIDDDRVVRLRWRDSNGQTQRVALTPGDIVAGEIATSYLEHGHVQGAAAGTVHISQGRTVESAIAVLDPQSNAAAYVALSRDRGNTTLVLSAEAVAETPEELDRLLALPASERDTAVVAGYAARLHEAGVLEAEDRQLLVQRWPEFRDPDRAQTAGPNFWARHREAAQAGRSARPPAEPGGPRPLSEEEATVSSPQVDGPARRL